MLQELEYDGNMLSYLSRKLRHEQRKTQADAAFGKVSKSTIHNLEGQEKFVATPTIQEHFENLGIPKSELARRVDEISKDVKKTMFSLKLIKMMIDGDNPEQGLIELKSMSLPKYHPMYSYQTYLHARYFYFHQENWDEAENYLLEAMRQYNKSGYQLDHQLVADCYNLLGLCEYRRGNFMAAINYTQEGLSHATSGTLNCVLSSNIILYLSYLKSTAQALYLINQLWDEVIQVDKIGTRLNVYLAKTKLLMDAEQLDEAVVCGQEGLDLAFLNHEYNRAFELLNVLGNVHASLGEWQEAHRCYNSVIVSTRANNRRKFDARLNLCSLAFDRKDFEVAIIHLKHADEILDKNKTIDFAQLADLNLMYGEVFKQMNDYERSLHHYKRVIEEARENNSQDVLIDALNQSLDCLISLDRIDDFTAYCKEIHTLNQRVGGVHHAQKFRRW